MDAGSRFVPDATIPLAVAWSHEVGGMVDKVISERFEHLLAKADKLKGTVRRVMQGDSADDLLRDQWITQCMTLLESILPEGHPYIIGFQKAFSDWTIFESSSIDRGKGVLLAAREDFENGYLWTIKERVHSEVFDDYLEMASYLIKDEGLKDPAAVIVGSTLEEHLRKLCQKHGISTTVTRGNGSTAPKKASAMNLELRTQGVYNQPEWRQIDAWLDIRNDAAHGHYDNYKAQQVEQMIDGIGGFMARNPA